jgi:hypothetical protein
MEMETKSRRKERVPSKSMDAEDDLVEVLLFVEVYGHEEITLRHSNFRTSSQKVIQILHLATTFSGEYDTHSNAHNTKRQEGVGPLILKAEGSIVSNEYLFEGDIARINLCYGVGFDFVEEFAEDDSIL